MATNTNDRNDARSIAQVVRSGWFKTVHVKSVESQELRTLLVSREFLVNKIRDHENEIRGSLRPHGLKVGKVGARDFEARVRELCEGRPRLAMCMEALLRTREALRCERTMNLESGPGHASRCVDTKFAHDFYDTRRRLIRA